MVVVQVHANPVSLAMHQNHSFDAWSLVAPTVQAKPSMGGYLAKDDAIELRITAVRQWTNTGTVHATLQP